MTKSTRGTKLPRKLEQKMQLVGEQIRLARLRRDLSIAQIAERATCSQLTVSRVIAKDDSLGRTLQDIGLKYRERASKKE